METKTAEVAVLDPVQLEKSFDESITALRTLLGGGDDDKDATDLEKAKKKPPEEEEESGDEEEDETDEEESDEEEDEGKKNPFMKKSRTLGEFIEEGGDEDAKAAMDVEPFLKALVDGVESYINQSLDNLHKSLVKKINGVGELTKSLAQAALSTAEMQKSIRDVVYKIGKTPIPSGTVLRKAGDRFEQTPEEKAIGGDYDKAATLQKSYELLKAGKIDLLMATKIEGRVSKNMPLPVEVAALFNAEGGKQ
jgi:hypothetical protein